MAGRLAAWGSAVLAGTVSPDQAADEVVGGSDASHRVFGLPDESEGVTLPYALGRLRALGVGGLRLVLPRPGDPAGLPGPPVFNEKAIARGEAVITVGGRPLGLVDEGRGAWSVHPVTADPRTPPSLADAERELGRAMRECTEALVSLDVARWEPVAADILAHRARHERPALPMSAPPQAHRVLHQALRLASIVDAARAGDGAAVSAGETARRAAILREIDVAARRAVEAACSAPLT